MKQTLWLAAGLMALTTSYAQAGNLTNDWFGSAGFQSGEISRSSYENKFNDMDNNKDGKIAGNEQGAFKLGENWFAQGGFDINRDGIITKDEYNARFNAMDRNSDNRISRDERAGFSSNAFATNTGAYFNEVAPAAGNSRPLNNR